ncbi:MAG: LPS assembly lipoprotein LptE [Acidobacteriota bacterium]
MKRVLLLFVCVVALASVSCGYALAGRGNSLPSSIVKVGIPPFVNQSTTPDIDRVLTTAVTQEWQGKGKYRVQPDAAGADAVLKGTILSVGLVPLAFTANQQVSKYSIVVTASIEFRETATDKVLWANPSFQARDDYDVAGGVTATDVSAIFTQNQNALDRIAKAFARTVVTSIFEAF